jgi:CheY-like chemotaxis protein
MTNSDLRILLAEDNEVNQHLMMRILGRIGYDAVLAKTGIQVLNKMDRQDFDIVFMDIQMPEMDGVTAAKLIRSHYPPEKQPRIIALTAETSIEGRNKYLAAGMDDVLTKPVQIEALVNILTNLTVQSDPIGAVERDQNKSTSLNDFPILEEEVMRDFMGLMGEDGKDSARHLVELFKSGTPVLIEHIETASEKKNKEDLLKELHTLKGSSSQVGGKRLEQFCARLEVLVKQSGIDPFATFIPGLRQEYLELRMALDDFLDKD